MIEIKSKNYVWLFIIAFLVFSILLNVVFSEEVPIPDNRATDGTYKYWTFVTWDNNWSCRGANTPFYVNDKGQMMTDGEHYLQSFVNGEIQYDTMLPPKSVMAEMSGFKSGMLKLRAGTYEYDSVKNTIVPKNSKPDVERTVRPSFLKLTDFVSKRPTGSVVYEVSYIISSVEYFEYFYGDHSEIQDDPFKYPIYHKLFKTPQSKRLVIAGHQGRMDYTGKVVDLFTDFVANPMNDKDYKFEHYINNAEYYEFSLLGDIDKYKPNTNEFDVSWRGTPVGSNTTLSTNKSFVENHQGVWWIPLDVKFTTSETLTNSDIKASFGTIKPLSIIKRTLENGKFEYTYVLNVPFKWNESKSISLTAPGVKSKLINIRVVETTGVIEKPKNWADLPWHDKLNWHIDSFNQSVQKVTGSIPKLVGGFFAFVPVIISSMPTEWKAFCGLGLVSGMALAFRGR